MRNQPTYILLDNSIAMIGKPIQDFKQLIVELINSLKCNPQACEIVYLSIITYNNQEIKQLFPLTPIIDIKLNFDFICQGKSDLFGGLKILKKEVNQNTKTYNKERKSDFKPILYIMTGVAPSQLEEQQELFDFLNLKIGRGYGIEIDESSTTIDREKKNHNKTVHVITFQLGYVNDYFKRFFENVDSLSDNINLNIKQPFYYYS